MTERGPMGSRFAQAEPEPAAGRRPVPAWDQEADERAIRALTDQHAPARAVLVRGGVVVTVDPALGTLQGDVLIQDGRIAEVGPDLSGHADEEGGVVIDARGTIVMPGLVDSHNHAWMGQLRGLAPAIDFGQYMGVTSFGAAPHYRPHDAYVGTLATALRELDGGVTTLVDNSNNSRTPDHSAAAVEALLDAGIRGVHASGAPTTGPDAGRWPQDALRLREQYFSSEDQLLTLRLFEAIPDVDVWRFARDHELWMSHEWGGGQLDLAAMQAAGLLTHRHSFNHGFSTPDEDFRRLADAGAQINLAPRSDANFQLGPGRPPVEQALAARLRPGLSMDNEISYGLDMFVEMQVLHTVYRARRGEAALSGTDLPELTLADVVQMATLGGAANAGLDHRTGSLTPGKDADLIMVRTTDLNTTPGSDALGTLVGFANRGNVDTVLVGGRVKKWRGALVGVDLPTVLSAADASRDRLLQAQG